MGKDLWLAVVILLVGVGCGREFGIEGRIDKAVGQDMKEVVKEATKDLKKDCPVGMHRKKAPPSCTDTDTDPACKPGCVEDPH